MAERGPTLVVAAAIVRGTEILLARRYQPELPEAHLKWELPGGKIEFGETPEQALIREIREELGLKVKPMRLLPYLHTNFWVYEHVLQQVTLACYECEQEEGSEAIISDDIRWFNVRTLDFESTPLRTGKAPVGSAAFGLPRPKPYLRH